MNDLDIRKVVQEELNNIAPEVDLASVDPAADLREAIDIDSMDFLNFITAIHHRLGVEIPGARLSEACHHRWGGRLHRGETRIAQDVSGCAGPASLVDATELVRMTKPEVGLMRIEGSELGQITIDGRTYEHDVIVGCHQIRSRRPGRGSTTSKSHQRRSDYKAWSARLAWCDLQPDRPWDRQRIYLSWQSRFA